MSIPSVPVVILAGGQSRRMGGQDKALAQINGKRMVDIVVHRLWPQCHDLFVCGPQDYGLGVQRLADHEAHEGPCAGVLGAAQALQGLGHGGNVGFITVPVDGPFLPADLVRCLAAEAHQCAVARDDAGLHATFAYWTFAAINRAVCDLPATAALRKLAKFAGAREDYWPGTHAFANINTPDDLKKAARRV